MWKFAYILAFAFAFVNAKLFTGKCKVKHLDRDLQVPQVSYSNVTKNKNSYGSLMWNEDIKKGVQPIKVLLTISDFKGKILVSAPIPDLCGEYKGDLNKVNTKLLTLKLFANGSSCPIKKGTSVTIPKEFTVKFDCDELTVGKYIIELALETPFDNDYIVAYFAKVDLTVSP